MGNILRLSGVAAALCLAFSAAAATPATTPRNVIFMIGDGMGPAYTTGYRYYSDDPKTPVVETTIFDEMLVGMASTYPDDDTVVTDSAAAATALSSGHKSYIGAIGVDKDEHPLTSMLEVAKRLGMSTGVAVTSQINHATPAGFLAHVETRNDYNAIADAYMDDQINGKPKADVMLGGGQHYFSRPDRDLVAEFKKAGYTYVSTPDQLKPDGHGPLLGLFADIGMPAVIDDEKGPRLPAMTQAAIDRLDDNQKGFFLMVEGSQIDWGGHANDIVVAMSELDEFAQTVRLARDYAKTHGDTLVVVTADHSTGGLTLGAGGEYLWHGDVVKGVKWSPAKLAHLYRQTADFADALSADLGFKLSDEEITALKAEQPKSEKAFAIAIRKVIDQRSYTGWTTGGHTAVDVQVFAFGPGAEALEGHLDNTDIAKILLGYIEKR